MWAVTVKCVWLCMDLQSGDNRWLFMLGDGKPHLCSKTASGSRCERPLWSVSGQSIHWRWHFLQPCATSVDFRESRKVASLTAPAIQSPTLHPLQLNCISLLCDALKMCNRWLTSVNLINYICHTTCCTCYCNWVDTWWALVAKFEWRQWITLGLFMCLCLFLQNIIYLIQINQSLQLVNVPLPRRLCFSPMWVFLCFLVDLSAGLHRNHWPDLHNTWMGDGSRTWNKPNWLLGLIRIQIWNQPGSFSVFVQLCKIGHFQHFCLSKYHFNRFYFILYQAWLNRSGTVGTWLDVCAQLGAILVITANVLPVILSCDMLGLSDLPSCPSKPASHNPCKPCSSAHQLACELCHFSTEVSPRWSPLSLHPDTRTCTPHGPQKKLGAALRKRAR